jgi:hypothetical protein
MGLFPGLNRDRINLSGLSDVPGGPVSNCNWTASGRTHAPGGIAQRGPLATKRKVYRIKWA